MEKEEDREKLQGPLPDLGDALPHDLPASSARDLLATLGSETP